jgi:carboxymethylenebutenolidase
MCDELIHPGLIEDLRVSRRAFAMLLAAAAGTSGNAARIVGGDVAEKDVVVNTPDGSCDAVLFHPDKKGSWPAVLVWPDIMGLRPAFRAMGRQLANEGYAVLVPNPFYRSKHAPVIEGKIDFGDPAQRQMLVGFRQAMTDDGIVRDAQAYLAFLDAQLQTNKAHKAGVQGYCMGGELSFRTAAAMPGRIGAVGSFHGGNGLVTDKANSPHLLIPKTDATFLVCQAQNDDAQKPSTKDALKAAFAAAHRPATVEVYPANHGWCVPGSQVYDEVQAQRAWAALTTLYRSTLLA